MATGTAFAQGMQGRGGQRPPRYDQSTVTTVSGTIQSIDTLSGRGGMFHLIQIVVKDSAGSINASVGPTSYLDDQKVAFKVGDTVEVTGSKVQFNGNDVILSAQIKDNGKTVVLRDENGRPVWFRGGTR